MKLLQLVFLTAFVVGGTSAKAQQKATAATLPQPIDTTVEASCGMCQFDMKMDDCKLAVRIAGKPYLVSGTSIDDHGDAHAKDGFCKAIRRAKVIGHINGDTLVATSFALLPVAKKK